MIIKQPLATFYDKEGSAQYAFLNAAKKKVHYVIELAQKLTQEELNELYVSMWPTDLVQPPYQFKYSDKAKYVVNPGRADFAMPIDDREDASLYVLSIFADGNKVDVSKLQFYITWN
jgi:hypothetical protein